MTAYQITNHNLYNHSPCTSSNSSSIIICLSAANELQLQVLQMQPTSPLCTQLPVYSRQYYNIARHAAQLVCSHLQAAPCSIKWPVYDMWGHDGPHSMETFFFSFKIKFQNCLLPSWMNNQHQHNQSRVHSFHTWQLATKIKWIADMKSGIASITLALKAPSYATALWNKLAMLPHGRSLEYSTLRFLTQIPSNGQHTLLCWQWQQILQSDWH